MRKLQIGFQGLNVEDFESVDILPGADHQADARDLSKVAGEGELEAIYASHVLEHFGRLETQKVLDHWASRIADGGKLYVAVPDFSAIVAEYLESGLTEWLVEFICGGQRRDADTHLTIFDAERLSDQLYSAGFTDVEQVDVFPQRVGDCSTLAALPSRRRVSLNMVATK